MSLKRHNERATENIVVIYIYANQTAFGSVKKPLSKIMSVQSSSAQRFMLKSFGVPILLQIARRSR